MAFAIKVNGNTHSLDVDGDTPLLWVLRDVLGMTGTKFGCGMALCGACHCSYRRRRHPLLYHPYRRERRLRDYNDRGYRRDAGGGQDPEGLARSGVVQCGYCQSGQIMSASALLASNPHPTDAEIDDTMSGNICRCGTYVRVREAIKLAAQSNGQGGRQ